MSAENFLDEFGLTFFKHNSLLNVLKSYVSNGSEYIPFWTPPAKNPSPDSVCTGRRRERGVDRKIR